MTLEQEIFLNKLEKVSETSTSGNMGK